MECKHKLIGDAAGVHCLLCGKRWTPDEYKKFCEPKKEAPKQLNAQRRPSRGKRW